MRRGPLTASTALPEDAPSGEARLDDLEQLTRLAAALHAAMDPDTMRRTLQKHLGPLIGKRELRLTVADDDGGRSGDADGGGPGGSSSGARSTADPPRRSPAWETFPLAADDTPVGSLDVARAVDGRPRPLSGWQRRLLELAAPLAARAIRNARLLRDAWQQAAVDALTGCLTGRHGMELVRVELRRAQRYARPTALAFVDLDHFKQINDRHGHPCGDAVLQAVGAAMRAALRGSDLCCRYGGDEFVLLLPETPLDGAQRAAKSLRRKLAATTVERPEGPVSVTASIGVAAARLGEMDAASLLARADAAMYRAKRAGRNTVRADA